MGIFSRISNMAKASVNNALDDMEKPIQLLDQKIRDMEKSLNEAKLASAQVLGEIKQTEKKMNEALEKSADWDAKVKQAVAAGNTELAKKALAKKLEADESAKTYQSTFTSQKAKGDALKARLRELGEELEKTRSYRNEAAARMANAEATQKVNEILADVTTQSNSISLDSIERKIAKKETMADGLADIAGMNTSLEDEFKDLGRPDLDAELAKYLK